MAKDIARQLLDGSDEIDLMKKEIDQLVKMVVGLVREWDISRWRIDKIPSLGGSIGEVFRSPGCEWAIELSGDGGGLNVTCDLIFQVCHPGDSRAPEAYRSRSPLAIRREHVEEIHKSLPVFVKGMAEAFPDLSERWQPFLKAAERRNQTHP